MKKRFGTILVVLVVLTTLNAAYLAAFDSPTIFYYPNVIARGVLGGVLAAVLLAVLGQRSVVSVRAGRGRIPWIYAAAALVMAATGIYLARVGTSTPYIPVLRVHEAGALVFLVLWALRLRAREGPGARSIAVAAIAVVAIVFPVSAR